MPARRFPPPLSKCNRLLCRAADVIGRCLSSHEAVHPYSPGPAWLANRLLGLAVLGAASLSCRSTSRQCDGDKQRSGLYAPSPVFHRADHRRLSARYRSGEQTWRTRSFSNVGRGFSGRSLGVRNYQSRKFGSASTGRYCIVRIRPCFLQVWEPTVVFPEPCLECLVKQRIWLGRFSIWLPPGAVETDQFRLRMQLLQWRWKLTRIDLPEKLRNQIAEELAKKYP